jgi:hypothetical protein
MRFPQAGECEEWFVARTCDVGNLRFWARRRGGLGGVFCWFLKGLGKNCFGHVCGGLWVMDARVDLNGWVVFGVREWIGKRF